MLVRSLRQEVSKQLASVRSGETSKVDFPKDLSSEERKYIHQLAQRFGVLKRGSRLVGVCGEIGIGLLRFGSGFRVVVKRPPL